MEKCIKTHHRGSLQNDVSNLLFINITFGGVNRGDEEFSDFATGIFQGFILLFRKNVRLNKQLKPIFGLITFFQSNLHFCNKIGAAACVICFVNVCTDACAAS